MSEVLIDITRLLGRSMNGRLVTGVDRVGLEYVRHFAGRARAVIRYGGRTLVLPGKDSRELFACLVSPRGDVTGVARRMVVQSYLKVGINRKLSGSFLFNTGHSGLEKIAYPGQLRRLGVRPLFLIHDLIPIAHPEYSRPGEMQKHVTRIRHVVDIAAGVITNSQATLDELRCYTESIGHALPPSIAAPLGAPEFPTPSLTRPLPQPYFVMLGTIEPRKNHWLLLQMWRRLIHRMGDRVPRLVIIGRRGWECESAVDLLERCQILRGIVTELPTCSDADLATYLKHSVALLFPSFAEGYGLPLVEALSFGVPVIASDLPVFREIAGDIPDYLDPLDGTGWMSRIEAFAHPSSPERQAQLIRLANFKQPRWQEHFKLIEEFIGSLE